MAAFAPSRNLDVITQNELVQAINFAI